MSIVSLSNQDAIKQELAGIKNGIVLAGEGRWQTADEVLIHYNVFDDDDLILFALRFLNSNVTDGVIAPYDEEDLDN